MLYLVLAVQNMEASGTVARDQEIEFNALCGSLSMMSKGMTSLINLTKLMKCLMTVQCDSPE